MQFIVDWRCTVVPCAGRGSRQLSSSYSRRQRPSQPTWRPTTGSSITSAAGRYDAYFDLAGPQSAWSFHSAGGGCHVDGTLVAGAPTAWAVWYLPNSSNYNHTYHAVANIVCATPDHRGNQVNYRMYPWGSLGAYRAYVIDQRTYCSWREITYLGFTATQGGQARVVNGTACGNCAGMRFVVDAFQWYP